MSNRLYDDIKIKTLILYLMDELDDEYDFETISEIIVWDDSINYFVFNDCFNKLVESGMIEERPGDDPEKHFFKISEKGKLSLASAEDELIHFVKQKILRSATRLIAFKKTGSSISCSVDKEGEGYRLTCAVKNSKYDLMQLKLYLDNKEEADIMRDGFDKRAETVYKGVIALLTGDFKYLN